MANTGCAIVNRRNIDRSAMELTKKNIFKKPKNDDVNFRRCKYVKMLSPVRRLRRMLSIV